MKDGEKGLFGALKKALRESKEPLTCVMLYQDYEGIKTLAASPNRVSDYLGGLWRKGIVSRIPWQRTDRDGSSWAYMWRGNDTEEKGVTVDDEVVRTLIQRPEVEIRDNGKVITIDLPNLVITINVKN